MIFFCDVCVHGMIFFFDVCDQILEFFDLNVCVHEFIRMGFNDL